MTPAAAREAGRQAGEEQARAARDPWTHEWDIEPAWDSEHGRAVAAAGDALVDAFNEGWHEGLEAELAVLPLRAGTDKGGVRFYVGNVPVRTGGGLTLALADGTPLRGRLEVTDADPWFYLSVGGPVEPGDVSFAIKPWHRFFPAPAARQ